MLKINGIVYSKQQCPHNYCKHQPDLLGEECINCNKRSYDIHATRAQQGVLL